MGRRSRNSSSISDCTDRKQPSFVPIEEVDDDSHPSIKNETTTKDKKKKKEEHCLYSSDYNGDDNDDAIDVLKELRGKAASKAINSVGELIANVTEGNFRKETTLSPPPPLSSSSSIPRN